MMPPKFDMDSAVLEQIALETKINQCWGNYDRLEASSKTSFAVSARIQLLERYWATYFENNRVMTRCEELQETEYYSTGRFDTTESSYLECLALLQQELQIKTQSTLLQAAEASNQQQSVHSNFKFKMGVLDIPDFSGDLLQWESFRDQFKALVHNDARIDKVHKLLYLEKHLVGEAAEFLKNTPITEANYDGAWKDIQERYDNRRVLSATHMRSLINLPPAENQSYKEINRLLDFFQQSIRSFNSLSKPVAEWDEWFTFLLTEKLDAATRVDWETSLQNSVEVPTYDSLRKFLNNRQQALQSIGEKEVQSTKRSDKAANRLSTNKSQKSSVNSLASVSSDSKKSQVSCPMCTKSHALYFCPKFKRLSSTDRLNEAKKHRVCFNCLWKGHFPDKCPSNKTCIVCSAKHNTVLHGAFDMQSTNQSGSSVSSNNVVQSTENESADENSGLVCVTSTKRPVLLATARIIVQSPDGKTVTARALLDDGSDTSLVSSWIVQSLGLARNSINMVIHGIKDDNGIRTNNYANFNICSHFEPDFNCNVSALIVNKLPIKLPSSAPSLCNWSHLKGLQLADPDFLSPAKIDILLGMDVLDFIYDQKKITGPPGTPSAFHTPFGWVIKGRTSESTFECVNSNRHVFCTATSSTISDDLQKFWELEEVQSCSPPSEADSFCEKHFQDTFARDSTGRFIVSFPFKENPQVLGESRFLALKILMAAERRNEKDPVLAEKYRDFMLEYENLGHMKQVSRAEIPQHSYYIPHHGVFKLHDQNKKIRVVFNASKATTSGKSLNDIVYTGPKLLPDLWVVLSRWRFFRFVFTTDIVKMYRQVQMAEKDTFYQLILWRPHPTDAVKTYRLCTVTYGTTSAQFHAIRCLKELAAIGKSEFPLGSKMLENCTYVDDSFGGGDTIQEATFCKDQLVQLLASGGFPTSKWAANNPQICKNTEYDIKQFQSEQALTTLGVFWNPVSDSFSVRVATENYSCVECTKRNVLSEVSKLFDPLGWFSPILVFAKTLIQDLWLLGLEWDDKLPEELAKKWSNFRSSLKLIETVQVPRWIFTSSDADIQIHGFSDASDRAYSAVIYVRVRLNDNSIKVSLLICKTRVAPVKKTSIPRLELCGAQLLTRLIKRIIAELNLVNFPVFAWTDSFVVLHWIRGHSSRWKPFVAHRVSEIQSDCPARIWRYVPSKSNPADLATKNCTVQELKDSKLWWFGPEWLSLSEENWPTTDCFSNIPGECLQEEKENAIVNVINTSEEYDLFSRFSTLNRLLRVTAYILRFVFNCSHKNDRKIDFLSPEELRCALISLTKASQIKSFPEELSCLRQKKQLCNKSRMLSLRPFLDDNNCIRLGGRLQCSFLPYDEKFPFIIEKNTHFSRILVNNAHIQTLHGGQELTRIQLLRQFWILQGRSFIKSILKKCVICSRFRACPAEQVMSPLPESRVSEAEAFIKTGLDYGGPIKVKSFLNRGSKVTKGYICLFVCMVTKAVHIELVSDLSTQSFLLAFHRFIARRAGCAKLYSDNGTNFKGASTELKNMFKASSNFYKGVAEILANEGTSWNFIPPSAPHFGGLWEAGIKSVKNHLLKVVGDRCLTFEEWSTFFCKVESCLNSRPLYPISCDAKDLLPLTPSHFLSRRRMVLAPEPPVALSETLRSKYKLISHMRDSFWARWSKDYLQNLQQFFKWHKVHENLREGALVWVKDELTPPAKWPLGYIKKIYISKDGHVRSATIKTNSGEYDRPIVKLIPLPIDNTKELND